MVRRAHVTSSIPPPMPGGVRCAPVLKEPRPRAELSQAAYRRAVETLRGLILAVDSLRDEGFDHTAIRARYAALLDVADKAAGELAHLDALNDQLWDGR